MNMNDVKAADLSDEELQNIMSLEKDINKQGQKEVYVLAFEKK